LVLVLSAVAVSAQSYATEARPVTDSTYTDMMDGWSIFQQPDLQPGDVNSFRQVILKLRNNLDFFCWTYPNTGTCGAEAKDVWQEFRDRVSSVYGTVGNFKDLEDAGVTYTIEEYQERLDNMLAAVARFDERNADCDFATFVATNPANPGPYQHAKLSEFFWGAADFVPKMTMSVVSVAAALYADIVTQAMGAYPVVMALPDDLWAHDHEQEMIHDFRKTLRAMRDIDSTFIGLPSSTCLWTEQGISSTSSTSFSAKAALSRVYSEIGNLGDELVAYQTCKADGNVQCVEEQKIAIVERWAKLRKTFTDLGFSAQLLCLGALCNDPPANYNVTHLQMGL